MSSRLLLMTGALGVAGIVLSMSLAARAKEVIADPTAAPATRPSDSKTPVSPLDFTVKDIDGKDQNLADYRGKVVMIINVASKCGNTPQYAGLEAMYKKYKDQGLVLIGFPANNFGHQEPGDDAQIKQFCTGKYDVTFPMMSKISVKGDDQAPLYKFLTEESTDGQFAGPIEWNFQKFLVDRNGNVIARFNPKTKPDDSKLVDEVEKALAAK